MHEGAIAQGILDTVLAALPPDHKRITRINVVTGVFAGVERECLAMYLTELSRGTPAQNAELNVERRPAKLVCTRCDNSRDYDNTGELDITCPLCGSPNRMEGGNELYVDTIEVNP